MSALTLDIARVKKYASHLGIDIGDLPYGDYFRITDDLTFSFWNFNIPQPSIQQLRIDYPDDYIKSDIALKQLRGYRNRLLANSDKFVAVDYPLSNDIKTQIVSWRQELRNLPKTIDPKILTLNETFKFDKLNIPEPPTGINL
jgi:hypothetical protein